jgi:hypothetical protein
LTGGVQQASKAAPTSFMLLSDAAADGKDATSSPPAIVKNLAVFISDPRRNRSAAWGVVRSITRIQ